MLASHLVTKGKRGKMTTKKNFDGILSFFSNILEGSLGERGLKTYRLRIAVQAAFSLLILLLGLQLGIFITAALDRADDFTRAEAAGASDAELAAEFDLPVRPPGVEGFLPISGFMGLLDWIHQGNLNHIHPAATALFLIFLFISWLLRKAFCSWICPIGFLSESLARLGRRIWGRNFRLWRWLDIVLRGVKYLLLGFFVWVILAMSAQALRAFIESPYNRVSDIKMYWFFVRIGPLALLILIALALGSIPVNGFWCRYGCPYGALLGFLSWVSPTRVRRNTETCIDCGLCDKVCMARLPVSRLKSVSSPECTGCLDCVASCPAPDTLLVGPKRWGVASRRSGVARFAAAVVLLFMLGYVGFRLAGLWDTAIEDADYLREIPRAEHLDHPQ